MPPRPAPPMTPRSLTHEARVEELTKEKTEFKQIKVDLEAKLNVANGEVRRLRRSVEDETGRRQTAEGDRTSRAAQMAILRDEIELHRSNLASVKCQLDASNSELMTVKSTNEVINTRLRSLLKENDMMYHDLTTAQTALKEINLELEKAKTENAAEEELQQIKGGFLKFAAAMFVYCTAMVMLKVVDPATNKHVKYFAVSNLITLCSTIFLIFCFYCRKWGKKVVLFVFGLLASAAFALSIELFYLQKGNLISA